MQKRKAQNRAAQRAFRERKEKHLKDLETKVEDLQKASESANHENSILRSQVEKMSVELNEYRKKISISGGLGRSTSLNNGYSASGSGRSLSGGRGLNDPNDVNFQFEFPRFGRLGPASTALETRAVLNGKSQSVSPSVTGQQITSPVEKQISPRNQSLASLSNAGSTAGSARSPIQLDNGDMSSLSGLFSPSILESVGKSPDYGFFRNNPSQGSNGSRSSPESSGNGAGSTGHNTTYSSPSASSNSNHGPSSSCGTSPEPTMQSPVYKAADPTLTTIGEEHSTENNHIEGELTFCDKLNMACGNSQNPIPRTLSESAADSSNIDNPVFDVNGIDWFAQQNGNQFDPQLFGDYREPQDNIIAGDAFGDSFFSDAFAVPDFTSPFNMEPSPASHKKDLVQQIDEQQNAGDEEVVPAEDTSKLLTCNTIWYDDSQISSPARPPAVDLLSTNAGFRDRLQQCPKVKEGEFDLDTLCKDLQKKAKCSETGAVVNESDFNNIMHSYSQKQLLNGKIATTSRD